MKTLLALLLASVVSSYASAYTVKYTYNSGGGITSRTKSDDSVKSRIAQGSDGTLQIESAGLGFSIESDRIIVRISDVTETMEVSYILSDIMGQSLLTGTLRERDNIIDISHLTSGTYVIYFITSENTYSRKLIKQ